MSELKLQAQCELGQELLMKTKYLEAEAVLAKAERFAWDARDFDTLARLYMPLQETRRQRRQRCGEGIVALDQVAAGPGDHINARHVLQNFPQGQLLVAGWASIEPAVKLRAMQQELGLYVETFLAAVYAVGEARIVAIVPTAGVQLPPADPPSVDDLIRQLPAHSIVLAENELPPGSQRGSAQTYARTMAFWERLHTPFLAAADMQVDPIQKIEHYRATIAVDYACELAHQKLADVAREVARK